MPVARRGVLDELKIDASRRCVVTARADGADGGDLARRVVHRREELGLSRDEVARRAGMNTWYLDFLEHSPYATLTTGALVRLASALNTTSAYLSSGGVDRPPGTGRAGPHPSLEVLTRQQCQAHLKAGGIGRFVFLAERGPVALPVNFRCFDGDIVLRTDAAGSLAAAAGAIVSFEVDRIDEAMSEGWSVIVTGRARRVDDPNELERVAQLDLEPWAGGDREAVLRIDAAEVSGRRIRQIG
jgi:nitroimidazol reductase NimA-like FMN-containing flavoprotein (pyridoxamine 5'-phosphate oxidase superfamily)